MKSWIGRLLKGVAIGIGAILPGLSGGVLAVIFGVYERMIRFLGNLRRDFVANVRFFLPVLVGVGLGILAFSLVVEAAFASYAAQFTSLFIGFVIGTFPSLWAQGGSQGRERRHLVALLLAAAGVFALMVMGGSVLVEVSPSFPVWLGSGALIGLGVVVPGMSPSNFLIYFGLYDKMATGIADLDPGVILPLAAGLVACVLLTAKGTSWLFDRYYATMYHLILGLVAGSSLAIFPTVVFPSFRPDALEESGLSLATAVVWAVAMLVGGAVMSYFFSRLEDSVRDDDDS